MLTNSSKNWKRILIGNIWQRSTDSTRIRNLNWDSLRKCLFRRKLAEWSEKNAQTQAKRGRGRLPRQIPILKTSSLTIPQAKIDLNLTQEVRILKNLTKWLRDCHKIHTEEKSRWKRIRFRSSRMPLMKMTTTPRISRIIREKTTKMDNHRVPDRRNKGNGHWNLDWTRIPNMRTEHFTLNVIIQIIWVKTGAWRQLEPIEASTTLFSKRFRETTILILIIDFWHCYKRWGGS